MIVAAIEHLFTQVVPVPLPRGVELTEEDLQKSKRGVLRDEKKKADEEQRLREKKEAVANREARSLSTSSKTKNASLAASSVVAESKSKTELKPISEAKFLGVNEEMPDFEEGRKFEETLNELPCIWDQEIEYALQVELLIAIQRLSEHFMAAAMSIQQSRPFDGVCLVVSGCMAAIADALMRKAAVDSPSEACCQLMGRTAKGKQLGTPGFGISISSFATQCETIEIHSPELSIAKTAVLDYFQSPIQNMLNKLFTWEDEFCLKPTKNLIQYLRNISREIAFPVLNPHQMLLDNHPATSEIMKNYPEFLCYRDIVFFWKLFLNTDRTSFLNYSAPESKNDLVRQDRMKAILRFDWDDRNKAYQVQAFQRVLACRPNPKQKDPVTGKTIPFDELPTHRFPSTATPHFYVPPPIIKTEDDVIYRPNLPGFENKYGMYYV